MTIITLQDLFTSELSDIYNAEKQLSEALPKMADNTQNEKLSEGFRFHHKETQYQIGRIEKVAAFCDLTLSDETCEAMEGLIKETEEMIADIEDLSVLDAALITAAQKIEHYEISSYGSLLALGKCLKFDQQALDLLEQNMNEEKQTDKKLTGLAENEGINERAIQQAA